MRGMEGLGVHRMWGASPAVDLVKALREGREMQGVVQPGEDRTEKEVNMLVVGAGDVRHALKTVAALRRNGGSDETIYNIYLYDAPMECLARHLLLLSIAFDWSLPVRKRAHLFLEVYGNALVQERTSEYIARQSKQLVQFVCDDKGPLKRLVDVSNLKFREADALETIFKSWDTNIPFDMKTLRDQRMRSLHGQRYDGRVGIVDWDYQEGVKPQAGVVHITQFKHWRETGVAFEFGDETYTIANRSMASYAEGKEGGVSRSRRGFWSDIVMSPYFAVGADCEQPNQHAKDLFKVLNKGLATEQHRHNTVHIAVYNLLSFLFEIETGKPYLMKEAHDIYSGLGQAASEPEDGDKLKSKKQYAQECASSILELKDRVKIKLITGDALSKLKYKNKFDLCWLSNHNAHLLKTPAFMSVLRTNPVVLVETARNMVMLQKDSKQQYVDSCRLLGKQNKLKELKMQDPALPEADLELLSFIRE